MHENSFCGKVALITGAAKRIGREIALNLARQGTHILVHFNRSEEAAKSVCREISEFGVKTWSLKADFRIDTEYESVIERALGLSGKLDILVNNASIFPVDEMKNLTFEGLVDSLKVNVWGPFTLCREFSQRVGHGNIVNLLDSAMSGSDRSHVGYLLSKHLLMILTQMCALEYAPRITVNGVAPGLILPPPGKNQNYINEKINSVPLGRHGVPSDIAHAVTYLLKSSFVTGTILYVDGGRHLKEYHHG